MSGNSFRAKAQQCVDLSSLEFYLWGPLKTPQFMHLQLKMKRHFTNAFWMPSNHSQLPRTFEMMRHSACLLVQVEDMCGNCELWLYNNQNLTVIKLETCVVNVLCHS